MPGKWQRLHLPKHEGLPPLLFKYNSTPKSYELYITDLTKLWSEQLSHKQILKRAEEDDTTIDPSEDSEQFKVLLQKIDEALRSSPGSSMSLTSGSETDSLELQLSTKLPAPLKPLKWNVYLSKEPHVASTNHLLLPLLREEMGWESRQRTLLDQLKQKDWVLAKLFDKVEVMGIDLSTVFPGISGLLGARKEPSLAQAAKYVKGVAPFDEQAWLSEINKAFPESGLAANLLTEFSGVDTSDAEQLNPLLGKWWESLDARGTAAVSPEPDHETRDKPAPKISKELMKMDVDTASENDEFERQETPPRFKQQKCSEKKSPMETAREKPAPKVTKDPIRMDVDTASEDEDDGFEHQETPPRFKQQKRPEKESLSPPPPKTQEKPPKGKGLGKTGGAKAKAKQTTPKEPSTQPAPSPQPPSTASTASLTDLEKPSKSKGLGKIGGGKAKASAKAQEKEPSPKEPSPQPPPTASTVSSPDLEKPALEPAKPQTRQPSDLSPDQKQDEEEGYESSPPSPPKPKPKQKEPEETKPQQKPQEKEQKKPRGGLGTIGGKKKEQKRDPTPTPPPPAAPVSAEFPVPAPASSTPNEPESSEKETPQKPDLPSQSQTEPKPKRTGKLGVIGGKTKTKTKSQAQEKQDKDRKPTPAPAAAPSKSPSPPGIGIRPKDKDKKKSDESEEAQKPKLKEEPESAPEPEHEETEQEKADRKREELKRQLDAKSKAPAKKKRKF